ncbi:MAG: hypothetical protein HF982_14720 [Desulfobacteraceae bacterium]|nr:hypothetical protein [Desulfobacteraceae bacterium]MBC2720810.1 hypothetical protein [Desulfobacteraceae bacterium]
MLKYIPMLLLIYVWCVAGLSDPSAPFQNYPIVRWLSFPIILGLFLLTLPRILYLKQWQKTGFEKYICGIALLITISTLMHECSLQDGIYAMGIYLRYPLFCLIILNMGITTRQYRLFIILFCAIGVLLSGEALFNYYFWGLSGDKTFISLGSSWGHVAAGIFFMYGSCLVIAHLLLNGFRISYMIYLALIIFISLFIASIRSVLIFMVPMSLIIWAVKKEIIQERMILLCSACFIIITLLAVMLPWQTLKLEHPFIVNISPEYRLRLIGQIISELHSSGDIFLGVGPRSMSPGAFGHMGSMYEMFYFDMRSILFGGTNQYVKAFSEIGVVGFIIYWAMLVKTLFANAQFHRLLKEDSGKNVGYYRLVSLSFWGIWIHYSAFGLLYNDFWRFDISSLVFWFFVAIIYSGKQSLLKENKDQIDVIRYPVEVEFGMSINK